MLKKIIEVLVTYCFGGFLFEYSPRRFIYRALFGTWIQDDWTRFWRQLRICLFDFAVWALIWYLFFLWRNS